LLPPLPTSKGPAHADGHESPGKRGGRAVLTAPLREARVWAERIPTFTFGCRATPSEGSHCRAWQAQVDTVFRQRIQKSDAPTKAGTLGLPLPSTRANGKPYVPAPVGRLIGRQPVSGRAALWSRLRRSGTRTLQRRSAIASLEARGAARSRAPENA
jgi:hypothetical protein